MDPKVQHSDGKQIINDIKHSIEKMLQKKVTAVKVTASLHTVGNGNNKEPS